MKDPSGIEAGWRKSARVFEERAEEYDSWYEDSPLFAAELAALQQVQTPLPAPRLEIGVGPGRFAEQLGVTTGIDPAPAALQRAAKRGIMGIAGIGEQLPVRSDSTGTLYLLFTLCFLEDPGQVLRECYRVLKENGRLVTGQVPAGSPLGQRLEEKKKKGNPYYAPARFYSVTDILNLLDRAGFRLLESRSALLMPTNQTALTTGQPRINEQADFCILVAGKKENI